MAVSGCFGSIVIQSAWYDWNLNASVGYAFARLHTGRNTFPALLHYGRAQAAPRHKMAASLGEGHLLVIRVADSETSDAACAIYTQMSLRNVLHFLGCKSRLAHKVTKFLIEF